MPLSSDQHIIDQKFSEKLSNYSVKPSSRVWWRIAQSISLPGKSSARRIILITAGFLLLGTSAGLYETLHHAKSSAKIQEQKIIQSVPEAAVITTSGFEIPTPVQKNFISKNSIQLYPKKEAGNEIAVSTSNVQNESQITFSENRTDSKVEALNLKRSKMLSAENRTPPGMNVTGLDQPGLFGPGSYYIGVTASINNTWLIDRQALASENLKYQLTLGASYGMQGGYYFANRWGIQTAWILNSWQGQDYKNIDLYGRTTSLDYSEKSISLTYMNIPLLVQYRVPKYSELMHNTYNVSLIFGGQYGRLLSYRIDGVKGEINSNRVFNRNDFAAVVGVDYDFMTDNPVFYSLGIRTSLGTNIFNENVPNYFEFDNPHNFVIGLRGAVNFGFVK